MNKKISLPIISGAAILVLSASTVINSSGVANWSGSPVDGGTGASGTCASCHSGGSSTPTLSLTSSPAFGGTGNNRTYAPSTTYTITIASAGSYARYGFNAEIINSLSSSTSSVSDFGTWGTNIGTNTQISLAANNGGYPGCAMHTGHSTTTPFVFTWKSPASGTGYLFADILGTNNNGSTNGDKVSAVTSITLTPAPATGINTHTNNVNELSLFPNPATDNLRITYTLKERGAVSVKIYNLSGELVADLLNATQDVGIQVNDVHLPSGLAKGLYMVKLAVNGEQNTQKLMVY